MYTNIIPILSGYEKKAESDVESRVRIQNMDRFLDYLLTTKMHPENHIPCCRKLVKCQEQDSVPNVFQRLSDEGFTSCPVLKGDKFVGFITLLDLVKFTCNMFWGCSKEDWIDFWSKEVKFKSSRIIDIMERKQIKMGDQIFENNSTFHALEVMVRSRAHRIPVFDDRISCNLVGILTQSMLISELFQRVHLLGRELKEKKVRDMTGIYTDIVTINSSKTVLSAFNLMFNRDVTGVAVVNKEGQLVDSISIKDLRGVGASGELFARLFDTISVYKEKIRRDYPIAAPSAHYSSKPVPPTPIYVTPDKTFLDVLRLMDDGNIHRVYVCSEGSVRRGKPRPIHVITQTDMLEAILNQYTGGTGGRQGRRD